MILLLSNEMTSFPGFSKIVLDLCRKMVNKIELRCRKCTKLCINEEVRLIQTFKSI